MKFKDAKFSTLLPPPNLTGILHLGHMWNAILQDSMIRYYKSCGLDVYWGYGLDHAGISLQIKVEEELRKNNRFKLKMSKEEFANELEKWKNIHADKIRNQYSQMRFLLPMSDERFTLDEESVKYVISVFKKLYEEGYIYRSEKLLNWDVKLNTVISDEEIVYRNEKSKLYVIKYYFEDSDEFIEVSTTRPETIFADAAIIINPKDTRYSGFIGKYVKIPLVNKKIPIIADEYVDMEFGTGAMKCTPAHDFNDYLLGKKFNLEIISVYKQDLIMILGPYKGLSKMECRKKMIEDLKFIQAVVEEEYETAIAYSSRSNSIVEPLMSKQWFLKSSALAKQAWTLVEKSKLFYSSYSHEYIHRLFLNMEDWCISRQLEWGIKIPVFLDDSRNKHSLESEEGLVESNDVFDTWFSSSLWPIIVFANKPDFFPVSVLISGKDILLFWIVRMIFMSVYLKKQLPFKSVYLHGLVLDANRKKMSKSLNNGVNPLDLMQEFSLDSIRLFFLSNTHSDKNISFSKNKLEYFSKFIHKLKNAYLFLKQQNIDWNLKCNFENLHLFELQILKEFRELRMKLAEHFEVFYFSNIANQSMNFARDNFCNKYLELYKLFQKHKSNTTGFISYIWTELLFILKPLIPDLCEEIYLDMYEKKMMDKSEDLSISDVDLNEDFSWFYEYMKIYTDIRKRLGISVLCHMQIELISKNVGKYSKYSRYFEYLNHEVVEIRSDLGNSKCIFYIPGEDLIIGMRLSADLEDKYVKFLNDRKIWLNKEISFFRQKLDNKEFLNKAPKEMILEYEDKIRRYSRDLQIFHHALS